jgi:hypothetical protein
MIKRNFFIASCVFLITCSASVTYGQQQQWQKRTPEERAQNQTAWMQKNIGLTQDQGQKVYDIILYYAREQDSVMNMPKGRDRKADRQSIEHDKDAELKTALGPDQYRQYHAHVEEMKQRMQQRRNETQQGEGGNGNY